MSGFIPAIVYFKLSAPDTQTVIRSAVGCCESFAVFAIICQRVWLSVPGDPEHALEPIEWPSLQELIGRLQIVRQLQRLLVFPDRGLHR